MKFPSGPLLTAALLVTAALPPATVHAAPVALTADALYQYAYQDTLYFKRLLALAPRDARAAELAGDMFLAKNGAPYSTVDALKYYNRASQLGSPAGHLKAARVLLLNPDANATQQIGVHLQALGNSPQGLFLRGLLYYQGLAGFARDDTKAVSFASQAASRGLADAELLVAVMYLDGRAVRKDEAKYRLWLESAARKGHVKATLYLADAYLHGKYGYAKNPALAREWFEKNQARGDGESVFTLAMMSYYGMGVPQNYTRAVTLLAGPVRGEHPDALAALGYMKVLGRGTPKDLPGAQKLLLRATTLGNTWAAARLAETYAPQDRVRAAGYLLIAQSGHQADETVLARYRAGLTDAQLAQARAIFEAWHAQQAK